MVCRKQFFNQIQHLTLTPVSKKYNTTSTINTIELNAMFFVFLCPGRNGDDGEGGALFVGQINGSVHFHYCLFSNNSASGHGGAIRSEHLNGLIQNCIFETNHAFDGGAIYALVKFHKLTIQDCIFQGNKATHYGGALYFYHISVTMVNCDLVQNICSKSGAMHFDGRAYELTLRRCKIQKNNVYSKVTQYTNAVWVWAAKLTITNCIFSDNIGSGLNLRSTRAIICNCSFLNNTGGYGGAITAPGFVFVMVITNTSFVSNKGMQASAIFSNNQRILIQSCQFQSNHVGITLSSIVIQSKQMVTMRICGCVFWKSQKQSNSVAVFFSLSEDTILSV